jgi:hypothetical protein
MPWEAEAMGLAVGDRIEVGPRAAYVIVGEGRPESRHVAYPARKVFWNARLAGAAVELVEADAEEWLDVFVRAPAEGGPSALERLRFEAAEVLGTLGAVGLPEVVDLIERGPLLVVSAPVGRPLGEVALEPEARADFDREVQELLALWREHGLTVEGLGESDFTIDVASGRWTFLGTDRVGRSRG